MEEIYEKDMLYIPQGLKRKREYFQGYGWYEFKITLLSCVLTMLTSGLLYLVSQNILMIIFLILVVPSTTVLFIIKNENNISAVDQIGFMVRYAREQKVYFYVYQDELAYDLD
jgi:hypothetical protein